MSNNTKLYTYKITYKVINSVGILGISAKTQKVDAKNQESAIETIRCAISQNEGGSIRIEKIEKLFVEKKLIPNKKKSMFMWLAGGVFAVAFISRVLSMLF